MILLRKTVVAIVLTAALFFCGLPAHAAEPEISAYAAALYSPDMGAFLYEKRAEERLPMASTTKIMTALLLLEEAAQEDGEILVTEEMTRVEGSSMGLRPGDRLTMRNLAAGMLAASGNDAAHAAALALDGSVEAFAARMNRRAAELGLENTHFVTPSGLDAEGHATTARDLARLTAAAMDQPDFAAIVAEPAVEVEFLEPEKTVRYENHNRLLMQFEGCCGVKTGYTKKAGRCLVTAAERDGVRLIAVTLNAPDDWNDHTALLEYGFSRLVSFRPQPQGAPEQLPVVGGGSGQVRLRYESAPQVVVARGGEAEISSAVLLPHFLYAPVEAGQQAGSVVYFRDGAVLLQMPVYAAETVSALPEEPERTLWEWISGWFH